MTYEKVFSDFEDEFLKKNMDVEIANCAKNDLTPLLMELLPGHQPVLEAGCGCGRWLHYLKKHGIEAIGIDRSDALRKFSMGYDPFVKFDTGDLRGLPYADGSFGAVVALGSIEHVIEGPGKILLELYRVLKKGGVGVITVPYFSPVKRFSSYADIPLRSLKHNVLLRKLFKKPPGNAGNKEDPRELRARRYREDVYLQTDFDGFFYQYVFTGDAFRDDLEKAGFKVVKIFPFAADLGIVTNFGALAGCFDNEKAETKLNLLGKFLSKTLSASLTGHMLGAVVERSS